MAEETAIQWCDSTLNLEMGCDGCSLWQEKAGGRKSCYAGVLTEKSKGNKGFPPSFGVPTIFPERMDKAEKWKDLTGTDRAKKPQLNGYPRIIFLNDMGDGFSRLLDLDWLTPFIPRMENTPHIYMMLTKRPERMAEFWKGYGKVPDNIWLGTSITANNNKTRVYDILEIPTKTKFLSMEPLLEPVSIGGIASLLNLVIVGFESGANCRAGNADWMRIIRDECQSVSTAFFCKQMGGVRDRRGELKDIPDDLRIRQMPEWKNLEWVGKHKDNPPEIEQLRFI